MNLSKGVQPRNMPRIPFDKILIKKVFSFVFSRTFIILSFFQAFALFELIAFLSSNRAQSMVDSKKNIELKVTAHSETKKPLKPSIFTGDQLFSSPDSLGVIAIGVAEGTRTIDGGFTPEYFGHQDSGNGALNLGTFAFQHQADSPQEADLKQIKKLREWVDKFQNQANQINLKLELFELLAGVDLINQSPVAGADYLQSLQHCKTQYSLVYEAVLCARIQSYRNPYTGEIEAAGFNHDLKQLKEDQQRRLQGIAIVLSQHNLEPNQN